MSILFSVQYVGDHGAGVAAICVSNGKLIGFDGSGGRYRGTYIEEGGRVRGKVQLTNADEWPLVTGNRFAPGDVLEMAFDWPREAFDGEPQSAYLQGQSVKVTATRIGEIP